MDIRPILRKGIILFLLFSASIFVTLFPDLFDISKFLADKSNSISKPAEAQAGYDPMLAAIKESVSRNSLEGKRIIEKAHLARPEFERKIAKRTVGKMIKDSRKAEGLTRIEPLGWEASPMKDGRWKLTFHYHRWPNLYLLTEWEYDHRANKLYLLNRQQGIDFWLRVASEE